jgi:hypothetical protein
MNKLSLVVHTCNPSTREADAGGFKFEVSLGYIASCRPASATIVKSYFKKQNKKTLKK